jgi:acyl-CoA thioesterase FadM
LFLGEKDEKTMRYDFEIHRKSDGELLCNGYITIIALNLTNWRATELPPDLIGKIVTALQ